MSNEELEQNASAPRSIHRRALPSQVAQVVDNDEDEGNGDEPVQEPTPSFGKLTGVSAPGNRADVKEPSEDMQTFIRQRIESIEEVKEQKKALTAIEKGFRNELKENAQLSSQAVNEVIRRRKLKDEYRRNYVADIEIIESACGQLSFLPSPEAEKALKKSAEAPALPKGATGNPAALAAATKPKSSASSRPVSSVARNKKLNS